MNMIDKHRSKYYENYCENGMDQVNREMIFCTDFDFA